MREIGKGEFIVVALSDKYLKSPNCMFELYSAYRESKLDLEEFVKKIYPIRVESIELGNPAVYKNYKDYWKDYLEKTKESHGKDSDRLEDEEKNRISDINKEIGNLLKIIKDVNAKTEKDLAANDYEEIKKQINKRIEELGG
ncbi:MAG: toll/interleukin-1 receptor domain-containing protein, partial [Bacteroidetes bacterium]|nr:toll/interleukin-1 receptor domain-containing protein [Bacteroidota bacterium]